MRCRLAALLLALAASSTPAPAQAPTTLTVPDNPRADSVRLLPVARFGSIDDPVSPAPHANVIRDSRGFYLVGPTTEPGTVARYDARGRFLGTVGRRGSGPGEFQGITALALGAGDSLYVYDQRSQRVTVIGPDFTVVRHVLVPVFSRNLAASAGVVFVSGSLGGAPLGQAGPVHAYSLDGARLRTFGTHVRTTTSNVPFLEHRRHLAGTADGVWVAPLYTYTLQRYGVDGRLHQTLARQAPWFPSHRLADAGTAIYETRPLPGIWGITTHPDGRLWVLMRVADAQWEAASTEDIRRLNAQPPGTGAPLPVDRWIDYRLELLDPRSGRVVAVHTLGADVRGFAAPGLLYGTRETDSGDVSIVVWSLSTFK